VDRLVIQDQDRQGITVNGKPLTELKERERVIKTAKVTLEELLAKIDIQVTEGDNRG
jgi:ribosomal protein S9